MVDRDLLRVLIRDVISEEVKRIRQDPQSSSSSETLESVRIANDADLAGFAKRVLQAAQDPKQRAAIEAGKPLFRLTGQGVAAASQVPAQGRDHTVKTGVVTEMIISKLPEDVRRLVVGPGVSVTPLARDKAKARGVSIDWSGK